MYSFSCRHFLLFFFLVYFALLSTTLHVIFSSDFVYVHFFNLYFFPCSFSQLTTFSVAGSWRMFFCCWWWWCWQTLHGSADVACSEHQNFFGVDDNLGPVAVSVRREKITDPSVATSSTDNTSWTHQYRIIIRTSEVGGLTSCQSVTQWLVYDQYPTSRLEQPPNGISHRLLTISWCFQPAIS